MNKFGAVQLVVRKARLITFITHFIWRRVLCAETRWAQKTKFQNLCMISAEISLLSLVLPLQGYDGNQVKQSATYLVHQHHAQLVYQNYTHEPKITKAHRNQLYSTQNNASPWIETFAFFCRGLCWYSWTVNFLGVATVVCWSVELLFSQLLVMAVECLICAKTLLCDNSLKLHQKIHTNEKPFSCGTCGKLFLQEGNLDIHIRSHTGEKPHQCQICSLAFRTTSHLKFHANSHSSFGEQHACKICSKAFESNEVLARHMKVHNESKSKTCTECDSSFTTGGKLEIHKRTHSGERPFACASCHKTFRQNSASVCTQKDSYGRTTTSVSWL